MILSQNLIETKCQNQQMYLIKNTLSHKSRPLSVKDQVLHEGRIKIALSSRLCVRDKIKKCMLELFDKVCCAENEIKKMTGATRAGGAEK